jgi:hypothetical protein
MSNSVRLQNFEKNESINNNIFSRNIPSQMLETSFGPRSVNTKYSKFPILDHKKETDVPIKAYETYNTETTFYPGDRKPHFCGFSTNIDKESSLRNQFFALQSADQAKYIPSTTSDLYQNNVDFININRNLDGSAMFRQESFNDYNPNISNMIGSSIFNNSTRVQLKNI